MLMRKLGNLIFKTFYVFHHLLLYDSAFLAKKNKNTSRMLNSFNIKYAFNFLTMFGFEVTLQDLLKSLVLLFVFQLNTIIFVQ